MTSSQLIPVLLTPLIAWRVYRRFRKNVGRQPYRPVRLVAYGLMFLLTVVLIGAVSFSQPLSLLGLAVGVALGGGLGFLGLKLSLFERTDAGSFYTPNTLLGGGISVLFVGRLIYRFVILNQVADRPHWTPQNLVASPLTLALFGLTAGYYIVFSIGVFMRMRRIPAPLMAEAPVAEAGPVSLP
jgi:hypothetical protein